MHEYFMAESVLRIVEESARAHGLNRVTGIAIEVGELAGVDREALQLALHVVLAGSIAQEACVTLLVVPGRGRCTRCGRVVALATRYDVCPACGHPGVAVTRGSELTVVEMEAG
ncbi:MAG: hydrogenase maturation nickel metallochaperone HypA [Betaproteobacteria bacterium]|nr:hydrogenase maturation nickel metallochaperone HypA [Betaproteobacteria bacterium]